MNPRLRWKLIKLIKLDSARRNDRLAHRARLARDIAALEEGGEIAIVYGGVDCDGGRWDDAVRILPAITIAVARWIDDYYDDAEGPQWHRLEAPSAARELTATSRDLALEAFENGHPHSIHL